MSISPHESAMLLEFLLLQPNIEGEFLKPLLTEFLPIHKKDSRIIQTMLLKQLTSDISDNTLDLLEILEDFYHRNGIKVLDSMKEAYCAVAVHCTLNCLKQTGGMRDYFDAVIKIWSERVYDMERFGNVGLISNKLIGMKVVVEEVIWNEKLRNLVLTWDTLGDAVRLVGVFVRDALKEFGESRLEVAIKGMMGKGDAVGVGSNCGDIAVGSGTKIHCEENGVSQMLAPEAGRLQEMLTTSADCQLPSPQFERAQEAHQTNVHIPEVERAQEAHQTNVHIPDFEIVHETLRTSSSNQNPAKDKYDISSPAIERVREALRTSMLNLRAVVTDPLPDALKMAADVSASMARERTGVQITVPAVEGVEASGNADEIINQCAATRPSLRSRNDTARTYEWSEESDSDEVPRKLPHLPTPRKITVSPLVIEDVKHTRRRKKFWSVLEEETLRKAVTEIGKGNWERILKENRDIFKERIAGDLKDKWRNMSK